MSLFNKGALVFDIGAHYGETVSKLAAFGAGKIISLEACPENYSELERFIKKRSYNAVPIHAAAWGSSCLLEIKRAEKQTGLSTVKFDKWSTIYPDAGFSEPSFVPAITLDQLVDEFGTPEYVKVDVEGAEVEVMIGMTFKANSLSFEFHGAFSSDAIECLNILKSRGYKMASLVEDDADLTVVPSEPIDSLVELFKSAPPKWGNITVI